MSNIYAYDFLGPYSNWEDVKTSPIKNASNPSWKYRSSPGTSKLNDVNGDGIIDANDKTIIGSPIPDFIWGMSNNFGYKGFDLSVQITAVQGGDRLMGRMNAVMARNSGTHNAVYSYYNNYWRPDRNDGLWAAPTRKSWDRTSNDGTLLFKGTYVNIQNITFGYSFPKSMLQKMKMSQLRIYTSIQNAWMITKYPGYNPEVNRTGDSSLQQGIDYSAYPMTRIIFLIFIEK